MANAPPLWMPPPKFHLPYMVGLNIPKLSNLINEPIANDSNWPTIPTKTSFKYPQI